MLTLRLKPVLEQRLEALARRTGRTKTFYAARAIERLMPEFEQFYTTIDSERTPEKVLTAIAALKQLRLGVTKPGEMTLKQMKEEGRS
jgi:RHH-type transcriptional regulator, rel operon repressor / antitoxin RelB